MSVTVGSVEVATEDALVKPLHAQHHAIGLAAIGEPMQEARLDELVVAAREIRGIRNLCPSGTPVSDLGGISALLPCDLRDIPCDLRHAAEGHYEVTSTIGTRPDWARPMAPPISEASSGGQSKMRCRPYRSRSPSVTR